MRKRTRRKKNDAESEAERLIELAREWYGCFHPELDTEEALTLREQAEPIFKAHPEYRDVGRLPYSLLTKNLYIAWKWFARYDEADIRGHYDKAWKCGRMAIPLE